MPKTLNESRRGTDRNIRTVHRMYSILNIVLCMFIARRIIGISHAQKQYEHRSEIRHVRQTVIRDPSTPLCTRTLCTFRRSMSLHWLMYSDKRYYNTAEEIAISYDHHASNNCTVGR